MFFTCLRAAEFILLSFVPSLISSVIFSRASDFITNLISLLLFLLLAAGICVLGYKFMSATGSRRAYLRITGMAYAVFAAIAVIVLLTMGEEGCTMLAGGLRAFNIFGISTGVSVILSLILLLCCVIVPGYVFTRQANFYSVLFRKFYRNAASRYRPSHRHYQYSKEKSSEKHTADEHKTKNDENDNLPTPEELEEWGQHEQRRREYEQRFTVIKPAKFTTDNKPETDEQIIERKNIEKVARLQQYYIEESKKKERPPVDREAELKKAHELEKIMNERKYSSNYKRHSHHEIKTVDKEAEIKKARELKLQLEHEEALRMEELRRNR